MITRAKSTVEKTATKSRLMEILRQDGYGLCQADPDLRWVPATSLYLDCDAIGNSCSVATYVCCSNDHFAAEAHWARQNLEQLVARREFFDANRQPRKSTLSFWGDSLDRANQDRSNSRLSNLERLIAQVARHSIDYVFLGGISGLWHCVDELDELIHRCRSNDVPLLLTVGLESPKHVADSSPSELKASFAPPALWQLYRHLKSEMAPVRER